MQIGGIAFFVPGQPVAKGRPRAFKMKNGGIGTYTPDKTVEWERSVRSYANDEKPQAPYDCPLRVHIQFYMTRPASKPKKAVWPTTKPDIDNLAKAVTDAMNGLIYTDDSRICEMVLTKYYEPDSRKVGVRVQVMELEG